MEPKLGNILQKTLASGHLWFADDVASTLEEVDLIFISVGTPRGLDGIDLTEVDLTATQLGESISSPCTVVVKSTVPPKTCKRIEALINQRLQRRGLDFSIEVLSNPEFLREGSAVDDFLNPSRVVIGASSEASCTTLRSLYQPLTERGIPLLVMETVSAELSKYAANAALAVRISFVNEIASISESVSANFGDIKRCLSLDPRIGRLYLEAGLGFGGPCLPKDLDALRALSRGQGIKTPILDATATTNNERIGSFVSKVMQEVDKVQPRLALWGVTFKAETSDIRESQAVKIAHALSRLGCQIHIYDPAPLSSEDSVALGNLGLTFSSALDSLKEVDALCILTAWKEFRLVDFLSAKALMRRPLIFDACNCLGPRHIRSLGFSYFAIGSSQKSCKT